MGAHRQERGHRVVDFDHGKARLEPAARLKCGPTIAAEAGEVRSSLAYRSLSMNVMSPGPASPTGRAEWIESYHRPPGDREPRSASCSTVATTRIFLSSLKGEDGNRRR